jgi:cysteine-rich repeat protein
MKKKGIEKFVFILVLLIFLASVVSAVPVRTCEIVLRENCNGAGDNIVMGLSSTTNAHGQKTGTFPYVLCCGFGEGTTTCSETNKIIGISSTANAHAETPSQTTYTNKICYENLVCTSTTETTCPTSSPLGVLSLSSSTNAHIGPYTGTGSYATKICCSGNLLGRCELSSASWDDTQAISGRATGLKVIGSGTQCAGQEVSIQIKKLGCVAGICTRIGATNVGEPISVIFGSTGISVANWDTDGTNAGEKYYFVATKSGDTENSAGDLIIVNANTCEAITTCGGYTTRANCENDASLCDVAVTDIEGTHGSGYCSTSGISCECTWDTTNSVCKSNYGSNSNPSCGNGLAETGEECDDGNIINGDGCSSSCRNEEVAVGDGCDKGLTLCSDYTCSKNCMDTDTNFAVCDRDGTCDTGEGCTCRDCNNQIDTCKEGLLCSLNDISCCNRASDGICTISCGSSDPDCGTCADSRTNTEVCGDKSCGTAVDNCLIQRSCGSCSSSQSCNSGICVSTPCTDESTATTCGTRECGTAVNNCGKEISCGSCSGTETCTSGGSCEVPTCTDERTNTEVCGDKSCGTAVDNCLIQRSCGSCSSSQSCNSGICVSTPCTDESTATTCGTRECGTAVNNCGKEISCGSCSGTGVCTSAGSCTDESTGGAVCGNKEIEFGEECDDGNRLTGDGCSSSCILETNILPIDGGCPEGTLMCTDGKCSLNCFATDSGIKPCDEGGCGCSSGLSYSNIDLACCDNSPNDVCNPYCSYIDPDCHPEVSDEWNCKISQTVTEDCDTGRGYKTISWIGTWTGTRVEPYYTACVTGSGNEPLAIPCPAQIRLPFFDYIGMIS